jgi:pentatricopeptide repeat protein
MTVVRIGAASSAAAAALWRAAVPSPLHPALRAMSSRSWSSRASGSSRSLLVRHVAGAGLPSGHGGRLLCTSSFAEQLQVDQDEVFASRLDNDRGAMDIVNGLNDAVQLLQEQEDQGVAADRTQDLFMTAVMHDSKLYDAVLAYFTSQKDANPNTETYTSLIYVCVKLRQLDEGFKHFERMMNEGVLPDNRTYAHLIKGCGRTKQIKRGEAFWRLLKQRNAPQVYDRRVFNAMPWPLCMHVLTTAPSPLPTGLRPTRLQRDDQHVLAFEAAPPVPDARRGGAAVGDLRRDAEPRRRAGRRDVQ